MRVNQPRAISIAGRQSLVAFDQQDRQREGYMISYRQRGGKPSSLDACSPPHPLIPSQDTDHAANLLVGNLPRTRIENLLRFDKYVARAYVHFVLNAHQVHVPTHRWRSVRPNPSSDCTAQGAACISTRGAFHGFLRGARGSRCSPRCEKIPATRHKVRFFVRCSLSLFVTLFLFARAQQLCS